MSLDRLVDVLTKGGNELARILAACWLLDNPDSDTIRPDLNRAATALLGTQSRDRLEFLDLPGSIWVDKRPDWITDDGIDDLKVAQTRLGYACDMLLGVSPCVQTQHYLNVWLDPDSLVTWIVATVVANRKPADFQKQADPRGWEKSAPLFFKNSELCDLVDGDFATTPNPVTIGNMTYQRLLLEHVCLGFAPGFPMDALNVLRVNCASTNPVPHFDVSLYACLEATFGLSWARGGLDVDRGRFSADGVNGGLSTRLLGTKVARFTDRDVMGLRVGRLMNLFAPFCLGALMSFLVFGGACYDPT